MDEDALLGNLDEIGDMEMTAEEEQALLEEGMEVAPVSSSPLKSNDTSKEDVVLDEPPSLLELGENMEAVEETLMSMEDGGAPSTNSAEMRVEDEGEDGMNGMEEVNEETDTYTQMIATDEVVEEEEGGGMLDPSLSFRESKEDEDEKKEEEESVEDKEDERYEETERAANQLNEELNHITGIGEEKTEEVVPPTEETAENEENNHLNADDDIEEIEEVDQVTDEDDIQPIASDSAEIEDVVDYLVRTTGNELTRETEEGDGIAEMARVETVDIQIEDGVLNEDRGKIEELNELNKREEVNDVIELDEDEEIEQIEENDKSSTEEEMKDVKEVKQDTNEEMKDEDLDFDKDEEEIEMVAVRMFEDKISTGDYKNIMRMRCDLTRRHLEASNMIPSRKAISVMKQKINRLFAILDNHNNELIELKKKHRGYDALFKDVAVSSRSSFNRGPSHSLPSSSTSVPHHCHKRKNSPPIDPVHKKMSRKLFPGIQPPSSNSPVLQNLLVNGQRDEMSHRLPQYNRPPLPAFNSAIRPPQHSNGSPRRNTVVHTKTVIPPLIPSKSSPSISHQSVHATPSTSRMNTHKDSSFTEYFPSGSASNIRPIPPQPTMYFEQNNGIGPRPFANGPLSNVQPRKSHVPLQQNSTPSSSSTSVHQRMPLLPQRTAVVQPTVHHPMPVVGRRSLIPPPAANAAPPVVVELDMDIPEDTGIRRIKENIAMYQPSATGIRPPKELPIETDRIDESMAPSIEIETTYSDFVMSKKMCGVLRFRLSPGHQETTVRTFIYYHVTSQCSLTWFKTQIATVDVSKMETRFVIGFDTKQQVMPRDEIILVAVVAGRTFVRKSKEFNYLIDRPRGAPMPPGRAEGMMPQSMQVAPPPGTIIRGGGGGGVVPHPGQAQSSRSRALNFV